MIRSTIFMIVVLLAMCAAPQAAPPAGAPPRGMPTPGSPPAQHAPQEPRGAPIVGAPSIPTPAPIAAQAGMQVRVVRNKREGQFIKDLTLNTANARIRYASNDPGAEPIVLLEGKFFRKGWSLICNSADISTRGPEGENFAFPIAILDEINVVKLVAVGPRGESEEEKLIIRMVGRNPAMRSAQAQMLMAEMDENQVRGSEFSLIARGAQSVAVYSYDDKDLKRNASGSALVGLASAELRWRGGKSQDQRWTWSGSVNFEMIRQIVLGETFVMPRGYARIFLGKEDGRWRLGPFAQASAGQSGIFMVESESVARKAKVSRIGYGGGGVAIFRPAPTVGVSGLVLLRMDTGGNSPELPSALLPSLSFEAGFGLVTSLSADWFFEGRLRALQENQKWKAANGSGESTVSTTFVIADLGIGYKF